MQELWVAVRCGSGAFPLHYLARVWQRGGRSRFLWCPLALDQPSTASSPCWERRNKWNVSQHSDVKMKRRRDLTRPHAATAREVLTEAEMNLLVKPSCVSVLCNGIQCAWSSWMLYFIQHQIYAEANTRNIYQMDGGFGVVSAFWFKAAFSKFLLWF